MTESLFQSVYEATNKSLWLYILKMVNDESLTDDIFQESYIRLLHADTEHLNEPQLKAYLFTIATNTARDYWRRRKRERNWFEREPDEHSVKTNSDSTTRIDVDSALQQLSPQQRSLLWLAYVEDYKHREIAETLNIKESSVKVLLFRAKQKFHAILQKIGIGNEVEQ